MAKKHAARPASPLPPGAVAISLSGDALLDGRVALHGAKTTNGTVALKRARILAAIGPDCQSLSEAIGVVDLAHALRHLSGAKDGEPVIQMKDGLPLSYIRTGTPVYDIDPAKSADHAIETGKVLNPHVVVHAPKFTDQDVSLLTFNDGDFAIALLPFISGEAQSAPTSVTR